MKAKLQGLKVNLFPLCSLISIESNTMNIMNIYTQADVHIILEWMIMRECTVLCKAVNERLTFLHR